MGNTSSQLAASQSQSQPQRPADSRASLPQLNGAASSQPEDLRAKKRRKSSGDAPRVAKKLKKDRGTRTSLDNANEDNIHADSGAAHTEDTSEGQGLTRKRSKKKSKKEEAQRDTGDYGVDNGQATQESLLSEIIPPSTMDSSQPDKQAKSKRKRHKGRPSGFNLAPMADPSQLEEDVDEAVLTSSAAVVAELPRVSQGASPSQQEERKDRKRKARRSGQLSPDLTNTQQSVPDSQDPKIPETQETQINGTSQEEQQGQDPNGTPAKKGKSKKRQRKAALDEENSAVLPTPPDAAEDGTNPPRAASPDTSHKWAAVNVPSQPESSQRSPKVPKQQRNGFSQHQDDVEGDRPDRVIQETPQVASGKNKKSKKNAAADEVEEAPSQDMPMPPASRKQKRKSRTTGEVDQASSSKQQGRTDEHESEPAESVAKTPKKPKRARPSTTDGEIEQQMTRADSNEKESYMPNGNVTEHKKEDKKSKKQASMSKKQDSDPSGSSDKKAEPSTQVIAKGAFTNAEKEKVDKIFGEMLQDSGMPDSEFRKSLQSWKDAADFKEAVQSALPHRPAAAIRKFCQRRYHNLERGMWSPEDDEKLKHAHTVHPGKWTEISALVGRTPADCKDRWRNSVSIEETMQTGPWSKEEEDALTKAVNESINELRKANKADKNKPTDRDSLEQMLSWNVVASKLGGSRSAKRCNEKWQKLNKRKKLTPADQHLATGLKKEESSKKLRAIEKYYNECDVGDLFDILTEIHTAIPDHSRHYDHESTLWSTIAMKNQGSRFKSAMRRRGLYDAADVYEEQLKQGQTIPAKAKALADHLEREWGVEALREKRAFPAKPKNRSKVKSSERVDSDDDEAEDDKAQVEDGAWEGGEEVDESGFESSSPAQGNDEEEDGESS